MWIFDFIYSIFRKIFPVKGKASNIVIIGLDNAGKSTMLYALKNGRFQQQEKTKTFDKEMVKIGGLDIYAWDLGGHMMVRQTWSDYYFSCQGIVFVIDASCQTRFNEAKNELDMIMNDSTIKNLPILILANKIDVAGSASYSDIVSAFNLKNLYDSDQITVHTEFRPIHLVMTSVPQLFGFLSGFKWLSNFI
ncbi:intracellular protein transport [Tritrichomonas musculus]|uniref:Intracellular protein transport n=1 Tax=Tritrichomonas musculus TaxID=1915356 RepID=A0ABR2JKX5_9EUKA